MGVDTQARTSRMNGKTGGVSTECPDSQGRDLQVRAKITDEITVVVCLFILKPISSK
jgi:hypothetical protein